MKIALSDLIYASGGELVGKIRLQKVVYLLEKAGLDSGLEFSYHHYGPYSSELSEEVDYETVLGDLKESVRSRVSDGAPYSVFSLSPSYNGAPEVIGELPIDVVRRQIGVMDEYSSTELELAATAYWLAFEENREDWRAELQVRKRLKAQPERIERAIELLGRLDLDVPPN